VAKGQKVYLQIQNMSKNLNEKNTGLFSDSITTGQKRKARQTKKHKERGKLTTHQKLSK